MKHADQPFQFVTAPFLSRINNQVAANLAELQDGIAHATDESIFYHTFQTLGRHHFRTEGFSNDFAQWTLAALNRAQLAERLASIDVRDYLGIAELRSDLLRIVSDYCAAEPRDKRLSALEPFYFCEAVHVAVPLDLTASTLLEFRDCVSHASNASFYHHFIASRLRLQLRTNDFSHWLEHNLDLPELARRCNRIDIYAHTIESARQLLTEQIDQELKHARN
jgi:hypothetical protein